MLIGGGNMMSTGTIRKFDRNGRIVIPKEIRDNLGLEYKTPAEMFIFKKGYMLKNIFQDVTYVEKLKIL